MRYRFQIWHVIVGLTVLAVAITTIILATMGAGPNAADGQLLGIVTGGGSQPLSDYAENDPRQIEQAAHDVCGFYSQGETFDQVNGNMAVTEDELLFGNQLTSSDMTIIQSAATEVYCPQYNGRMPGDGTPTP